MQSLVERQIGVNVTLCDNLRAAFELETARGLKADFLSEG